MRRNSLFALIIFVVIIILFSSFILFRVGLFSNNQNTSTNTNTVPPGSCGFFEEKFCDDGRKERIEFNGNTYDAIGFKLPEGAEIKVPFDVEVLMGVYDETSDFPLKGDFAIVNKKGDLSQSVIIVGDIEMTDKTVWMRLEGESIAKVRGNTKNNLDGYNVTILFMDASGEGEMPNKEMLDIYF